MTIARVRIVSAAAFLVAAIAAFAASCAVGPGPGSPMRAFDATRVAASPQPSPSMTPYSGPRLYVTDRTTNAVSEFKLAANGNAKPIATIAGAHTQLMNPVAIGFDASHLIYVVNTSSITVYNRYAHGNVAPKAQVSGAVTLLSQPQGIAVDPSGVTYVTNDGGGGPGYITVYPAGSNGGRAPQQTIYDVCSSLFIPIGIAKYSALLYVADQGDGQVNEYAATANGDVCPTNTITGLSSPAGVSVDALGRIYVTDGDSIVVYAAGAHGHAKPVRTISGANTQMSGVVGVTVVKSTIAVANSSGPSVTEYKNTANGNVAPLREVDGSNTGLVSPSAVGIQ